MIEALLLASLAAPLAVAAALGARLAGREHVVARWAQGAAAVSAACSVGAVALWLAAGGAVAMTPPRVLFEHGGYRLTFELVLDQSSAVFLTLVQFMTAMVLRFSRFYLHREPGFRRFFATVLMFQSAMSLLTLAGNLDLMFAGWEMVGVSSFLLIAFYRERHSAVRNALKTYSVYRVADMGMLMAAGLAETGSPREVGLLLLLAAIGKSAQFPFSFWVPRAMEGPTPSSALFYGALSVHAGAYLLLRTFPLWCGDVTVRVCVAAVGLVTAIFCTMFSRVQPTIKAQVGYASVSQVGLIFVEIALGLPRLALAHLVGNALLRCYQLLVSPSAVAYLLRKQVSAGSGRAAEWHAAYARVLPARWTAAVYVFALSEGYLKESMKGALWAPLRRLGRSVLPWRAVVSVAAMVLGAGVVELAVHASSPAAIRFAWGAIALAFLCSGAGLGCWRQPFHAVAWISGSSLAVAAAVFALSPSHNAFAGGSYAASMALFCALGLAGVARVVSPRQTIARYAGYSDAHPVAAACVLVSALGIAAFPMLPTFVGEDMLLHDTLRVSTLASALVTGALALNGYLAVRNFAFTFLGQPRSLGS